MLVGTNASKLQETPQKSSRQMGDVKQFPCLGTYTYASHLYKILAAPGDFCTTA